MQQQGTHLYRQLGLGLLALLVSGGLGAIVYNQSRPKAPTVANVETASPIQPSQVNLLRSLKPQERQTRLEALVQTPSSSSVERSRARYLLAQELLRQNQPQKAIESLEGLEADYPVLTAQVLVEKAQAHDLAGDASKAQQTWQKLLKDYPTDPAAVEGLYALGKTNPSLWDQAIAQFPAHPRTVEIVLERLKKNPKQPELLKLIARYGLHVPNYTTYLDRLTEQHASQLTPPDWEAIAFGYWEKQAYGKAGLAYARAPQTPLTAYRTARGLQLGGIPGATEAYQRLVTSFPDAEESGLGLMRLANIAEQPETAIAYLDQAISRFPQKAPEALLKKADLLDKLNSSKSAAQTRQTLLTQHPKSNAAAELRWQYAWNWAKQNDIKTAFQWAAPILTQAPDSDVAPQASFWVGKWAATLGKSDDAKAAFQTVLNRYPHSYYAWRSASLLGWDVGDFTTVRTINPDITRPETRPDLPTGSDRLKELYRLGQDQEAWALWQTEFKNPMQPSVAEQFTDGVMRLGIGDNLDAIFMVSSLDDREKPDEQAQVRSLTQQTAYWHALYPFPYKDLITTWSTQHQVNPLLVTALIRQESRFMPGIVSSAEAVGLMQVIPETAEFIAKQLKLKTYKLNNPEDSVKLGTWYLDYTHRRYNGNSMLAVASYNAGPEAVARWVTRFGLSDPDAFVEAIPYDETRGYVKSVFENYWNYLRLYNSGISQKLAQVSPKHPTITYP